MIELTTVDWIEVLGWLASILTVASYSVNTMMPLRILAIVSSVFFIIYATLLQLWPLVAMELVLLPINAYRFWQILSLRGKLRAKRGDASEDFALIKTYGKVRRIKAGTLIFERGDPVDQLYYLSEGNVLIEDLDVTLCGGEIFGEIAFFTDSATRTATARCTQDAVVYELDEKQFMRLQFEDPSFGLSVIKTLTRRLIEKVERKAALARTSD